jgi:hypothetical protein
MIKYLEKYPADQENIMAGVFAFGEDEVENLCKKALSQGKRVVFDDKGGDILDGMTYKFV